MRIPLFLLPLSLPALSSPTPNEYKYFVEPGTSTLLGHYDARFFHHVIPYATHRTHLHHLIRSYLLTLSSLSIPTWLAHGTLLGWWFNGLALPWDYDLDVQLASSSLAWLAAHHNMTVHNYTYTYTDADTATSHTVTKSYLLDVNPFHGMRGRGMGWNVIDARWIDMENGMFVDITGLMERDGTNEAGVWSCKNFHRYRTREIWPLRETVFEGVPALVPYDFNKVLMGEYGVKALVCMEWEGHRWDQGVKEWVKVEEAKGY